jgi:hypothetical protein
MDHSRLRKIVIQSMQSFPPGQLVPGFDLHTEVTMSACRSSDDTQDDLLDVDDVEKAINSLIHDGLVTEVPYTDPALPYKQQYKYLFHDQHDQQ